MSIFMKCSASTQLSLHNYPIRSQIILVSRQLCLSIGSIHEICMAELKKSGSETECKQKHEATTYTQSFLTFNRQRRH